jgi:hypothetical protein
MQPMKQAKAFRIVDETRKAQSTVARMLPETAYSAYFGISRTIPRKNSTGDVKHY